jgi:hypothetical protein
MESVVDMRFIELAREPLDGSNSLASVIAVKCLKLGAAGVGTGVV